MEDFMKINHIALTSLLITTALAAISPQEMLYKAILADSTEEIKQAVENGASVHQDINGKAPLFWAVVLNKTKAVEELLICNVIIEKELIQISINNGDNNNKLKITALLAVKAKSYIDIDTKYCVCGSKCTLLDYCLRTENLNEALLLIKNNADLNLGHPSYKATYNTFLAKSLNSFIHHQRNIEFVYKLIQEAVSLGYNASLFLVSDFPAAFVDKNFFDFIIYNGADPNYIHTNHNESFSLTPLFKAISFGEKFGNKGLEYLLKIGVGVNQKANPYPCLEDPRGGLHSPLSFAIACGESGIAEKLIEHGAQL